MKWETIKDYPNYMVSCEGEIKSLNYGRTGKEKILKPRKDKDGYLKVDLYEDGKHKTIHIHRLVAQAFLPNPNNLSEVNHKNEDKTDNKVANLEFCTHQYNMNYGTRTEKTQKPILQFSKTGEFIRRWDGIREVGRKLGFDSSNISKCCRGKQNSAYGFIWRYEEINELKNCA